MTEKVKQGSIYMVTLNDGYHSYRVGEVVECVYNNIYNNIFTNDDGTPQFLLAKHVSFIGELEL